MTLTKKINEAREKIEGCTRPLILFDDDPDGLSSFLLIYRKVKAGKGMPLKGNVLDEEFAEKVNEYGPDLVVVLDKAVVSQEFFDKVRADCIWVDHHDVQKPKGVLYINSKEDKSYTPTSELCYRIVKQDEWIAITGIVADWQLPNEELWSTFAKNYPDYLPQDITTPPQALFSSKIGILARIFSFNLKGKSSDILSAMKILTRINAPEELLEKKHAQAKLVMKRYEKLLKEYKTLYDSVIIDDSPLICFIYSGDSTSFTPDLSNELLYNNPGKAIIIARENNGTYKCSLRDHKGQVKKVLAQVLEITGGDGGGHDHACGAIIPEDVFSEFVEEFKKRL